MKARIKKIIPPILALVCTTAFFSCGKETQTSTQGGGICKIKFTITPEIPTKTKFGLVDYANSFSSITPVVVLQWNGLSGFPLATIESPEFSVTKGQNITCGSTTITNYDGICRSIKIECILNNKSIKAFTKELGYMDISKGTMCKDATNSGVNFIIP
jgi:hypothetical protein